MVNVLVDVVNGISAILHEIQSIMSSTQNELNLNNSNKWSQILMSNLFADHRRASGGWQFFDLILEHYFSIKFNNIDVDSYIKQVSCLFTAICLCEPDDFVRFIFDIYSEPTNENYISMSNLELLLQTIIGSVGGKKIVQEILNSMSLYASVVANKTDQGMYTIDDKIFLQKNIPTQYYTRKHKHGLWPLEVVQNQIKEKFLGSEFWERVRKGNLASINLSSPNAICLDNYLETISLILKEAPEVKKKQISDNSIIPTETFENGQNSQIIENDGIYTLKSTANLGFGHTISFLRRPVLARKSFNRLTDDDTLTGIDCPYVNENDVAILKQHLRTPSPDPLGRSSHGNSRHSSRQNSPMASKSSSFSFDVIDMGDSLHGSNGIAARTSLPNNNTSLPITSSPSSSTTSSPSHIQPQLPLQSQSQSIAPTTNLLRNRPNYKVPGRLITSNLPPLSNHSSRSSSPSFLNQGNSPGTSTTTSSENVPLDSISQEGGLTDILLEATYLMKGLKILIIEDSTFQRKLMTKKLHKTGGGEGQISRRPSGTFNIDKKLSYDQIEGVSIPLSSSIPPSPSPMNDTSKIFNFPENSITLSPSMISANMIPRPPTPSDIMLSSESVIDFPSASSSPFNITLQSPSSIYNPNIRNEVITPSQISHLNQDRENNGWQVSEAVNGEEAIQRLISTKETFDIIFVDENLQSTGGNLLGHEVVRILRGHHSVPSSTIIIGCSSTAEQNALLFLEAGANAVWKKPMPTDEKIRNEICKYLAGV